MKRYPLLKIIIILIGCGSLFACAALRQAYQLKNVSLKPSNEIVAPRLLNQQSGPHRIATLSDWQSYRPQLLSSFLGDQYGLLPDRYQTTVGTIETITPDAYGGLATIQLVPLTVRFAFGENESIERKIRVVLAIPNAATSRVPVILRMGFCPFSEAFQIPKLPGGKSEIPVPIELIRSKLPKGSDLPQEFDGKDEINSTINRTCESHKTGLWGRVFDYSLGRYHKTPPIREAIEKGYAYAELDAFDLVVDEPEISLAQLAYMAKGVGDDRWGILSAWAFQYSRAVDFLSGHAAIDSSKIAVYGHSRYGKSALLAAAADERIGLVISHQSGRLGAALSSSDIGESPSQLIDKYPHWVSPRFAEAVRKNALDSRIDQHGLLALIAPRPVLLGNGRRDRWADPASTFSSARAASEIYQLYGRVGLTATRLDEFDPKADIAFWLRDGTHGEVLEDWNAFFEFLDAHFSKNR